MACANSSQSGRNWPQGHPFVRKGCGEVALYPLCCDLCVILTQIQISKNRGKLARPAGLEPAAPSLEGSCSIQLSYGRARAPV